MNELPKTGEILHPYLRAIANGARKTREILPELKRHFALTEAQMEELIPSGAREYVTKVQQRVVLIDGARLARLMIDHGVGVVTEKTYVLRSVDANFFDPV